MRKVFVGLIILGMVICLVLKIAGCGQVVRRATNLHASGTIYDVIRSGNITYQGYSAYVTDLVLLAYSDSAMTKVVTWQTIDCAILPTLIGTVNYSLDDFSSNSTYYLRAIQVVTFTSMISLPSYNKAQKTITFGTTDLIKQNIILKPSPLPF